VPQARFGGWSMLPGGETIEALARAGFDFVAVDCQHGAYGFRETIAAIQLLDVLGIESLVRVSPQELGLLPRYLDFGADGAIVAMADDVKLAADAVSLARYQPGGTRSYGGQRYGLRPEPDDLAAVRPLVFVMIETRGALEAVEAIAAVPGLAGLFVGPVDLALALGVAGRDVIQIAATYAGREAVPVDELIARPDEHGTSDEWERGVARVVAAAHAAGIEAGMFATGGADARRWAEFGFDRVVVGSDIALLRATLAAELAGARGG
jgi:4-hydroxy-2-oxoheptanedioate aldolase